MLQAEYAAPVAALLGYLATTHGRRQAFICLLVLVATCARRGLEVVENDQRTPLLRVRFESWDAGIHIRTRRCAIAWSRRAPRS